jgi:hypothetical protein
MKTATTTAILLLATVTTTSHADVVTTYTDRTTFNGAAGGALTIEDFTETYHFPISTGVLNSETDLDDFEFGAPPILPGDIEAGATYSTPIGEGNFFNIDIGGQHVGGFLDRLGGDQPLTVDFTGIDPSLARSVSAFGFDLGSIGGGTVSTSVTISFESGPDQVFSVPYDWTSVGFFGFVSDASDITSVSIININPKPFIAFDLDNFTFNALALCDDAEGDLNGDGEVNGADLGLILGAWGPCTATPCTGDLNGDGNVNGADLGLILGAWGTCQGG